VNPKQKQEDLMALTLISKAFAEDAPIPGKHALDGENIFPPLAWGGAPKRTQSFALIVEDPDAPGGTFRHCGIANIPAQWGGLAENVDAMQEQALRFYKNVFRLAAVDGPRMTLPEAAGAEVMWRKVRKHMLAEASLTGIYQS